MAARMIKMTRFCRCSGSRGWGEPLIKLCAETSAPKRG
jgi:hypothetical protein